jgi:hypothetical protein
MFLVLDIIQRKSQERGLDAPQLIATHAIFARRDTPHSAVLFVNGTNT